MLVGKAYIQHDQGTGEDFVYTSDSEGSNEETIPMLLTCYKKEKQW